jgi:hypothetical protein
MKRYLDEEEMSKFIKENFSSVSEFCGIVGLSRSHFYGMLKRKIACGIKTQEKLSKLLSKYGESLEDLLEPVPIIIGDMKIKEILITDDKDNLIVSINSNNEIADKNYRVEYIPYF